MNTTKLILTVILFITHIATSLQGSSKPNFNHPKTLTHYTTSINIDGPILDVSIVSSPLQACEAHTLFVHYCNEGTQVASEPYLELTIPEGSTYNSSTIPLTMQMGSLLTFDLTDISPTECVDLEIELTVDCNLQNGEGACFEAHIFPDDNCLVPDPNWDQSSIEVTADCRNDSLFFYLQNVGTGNMSENLNFFIIEDDLVIMMQDFNLGSGEIDSIAIQPTGDNYYLESMQSSGHPGISIPNLTVEN